MAHSNRSWSSLSLGTLVVIYFGGRLACWNLVSGRPGGILPYLQSLYAQYELSAAWEAIQSSLAGRTG